MRRTSAHDGHGPLHIAFAISRDELANGSAARAHGIAIEGAPNVAAARASIFAIRWALLELATPDVAIY